ncbi:MAG: thioredoxin family protein [Myxococcota bacterium]
MAAFRSRLTTHRLPMTRRRLLAIGAVVAALWGCRSASPAKDAGPPGHLRLLPAPPSAPDQLAGIVAQQRLASAALGRTLIVYVGAPWCEPCRRFHEAAEQGRLDADFGDVDLLVFDAGPDAERLLLAGYESRLIPLLVVPGADGRATDRRMEGSVKGDAVADMTPRLKALLGR